MNVYDFTAKDIEGKDRALSDFRGKALLLVNVASRCGLTPHYTELQQLHEELGPRGFEVLGFPCNQFGAQEPGSRSRDQRVLFDEVRRHLSAVLEDRRQWRRPPPALRLADRAVDGA